MGMRFDHASLLRRVAAVIGPAHGSLFETCGVAEEAPVCRMRLRLSATEWMAGLPALGDVLYLPCRMNCPVHAGLLPGVLVESVDLVPLLHTRALVAAGTITPDGPREWIECLCGGGQVVARVYLLPDTDYLAWDALHAAAEPVQDHPTRTDTQSWHPTSARLLRFRVRRLAGMQMLGTDAGTGASLLGRTLAARIARDEVIVR